ncbi:bestrophin-like domain [Bradyrhizobium sp. USDA 4454]
MLDLYQFSLLSLFVGLLALVVVAIEIGWRIGTRIKGRGGSNIFALEQSLIGLLALIIGFTFFMALTRFEARREAVVNEANAIGTTALRSRLLPEPHRTESLKLLREYARIRVEGANTGRSLIDLPTVIARSNEIHEALWLHAEALAAKEKVLIPLSLFMQSLNEIIDSQGRRLAHLRNRIPNVVLLALVVMTVVSTGIAGYAGGVDVQRARMPIYLTGLLLCGLVYVILDLDRPAAGLIMIDQAPMSDVDSSMAKFSNSKPLTTARE